MDYYSRPRRFFRQVQHLIYPRHCPFCNAVLGGFVAFCPDCAKELETLRRKPSMRLSRDLHVLGELDGAAAPYRYSGLVRRAVLRAKYQQAPWAAVELGVGMAHLFFGADIRMQSAEPVPFPVEGYEQGYQMILPVPFSNKRRGYNVPERMAQPIAKAIGVPLRADLLLRVRTDRRQEGLSFEERLSNVANVFRVTYPEEVENKRILLIDDVITTGATVSACARVLRLAGAESVYAMAFATVESDAPLSPTSPLYENTSEGDEEDDFSDFRNSLTSFR